MYEQEENEEFIQEPDVQAEDSEAPYMAPEEEPEEETQSQEPVEEKPKKKPNIGQRLSEVQREKFQALDENRRLKEELQRLQGVADASTRTALNHYDEAVNQRLKAAKEAKRKAIESGDIDAQTEADVELGLAASDYQEANRLKAQQQMYEQQQYNYQYQQPQQPAVEPEAVYFAQEFVNENPWFDPKSDEYDTEMTGTMNALIRTFDDNLMRAGYGHAIMRSPYYFETIRKSARELNGVRQKMGGDLNMRHSRSAVTPVRQGGFSSQPQGYSNQQKLSAEEMEMARLHKIDPKVYLQHKMREIKETPWKRNNNYGR